ncbi:alcohol dehydrogenase catalytic domain-containing protein [Mycobacterium marseillense]|uniref:alcohol dehydrogenase catalytic domain-containing protein n=1 Tax=Mycobacterium marseillense TaxID=701042 RepID=UPI002597A1E7|nr:alcohol dehydrogenase catalytic domain-containing protein [Mycobacterium marseillense]MDM3975303.1 alcohol dehydrogenase catalytic domain-containing protein [Mycobacterium marseillense]
MTEVRAAVLRAVGEPMSVETILLKSPGPNDVRVRIDQTGVCHSDLSLARGTLAQPLPAVLGHEACGTVVEVGGRISDLEVGQRVILLWITPCGSCFHCIRGETHLCETGASRGGDPYASTVDGQPVYPGLSVGSFAEQTVVPREAVIAVPDDIATGDAALLGCAVTTGVGAAMFTAGVVPESTVLVLGLGGVGLSVVLGAKMAGATTIIAIDRNSDKAGHALRSGATEFLRADDNTKRAVRELTAGRGVDFAFDCVGSARTIRDMWSMTRRGGACTIVGIGAKDDTVSFGALELFHFARTVRGCVAGSLNALTDFPRYFEWVRRGELDLSHLITGHGGLCDVERALDELAAGQGVRTLLSPNSATQGQEI